MGFDLTVGPLDGIDEIAEGENDAWFGFCLAMFESVNDYLRSIGLPPHVEPRSIGGPVYLSYRQPLSELLELHVSLPEQLHKMFDQVLSAGLNTLFVPVDLPEPVVLEADGETFGLGSVPRLLFQSAWLQRLIGDDPIYNPDFANDLYGSLLDKPLDGFPQDLPLTDGGYTAGTLLAETLGRAAIDAYETNSSIRIC